MIPFHKNDLGQEEVEAVTRVLQSGKVAHGAEAHAFEQEFSDFISWSGIDYQIYPKCIFTNSCTSALKIAYKWVKETKAAPDGWLTYRPNTYCATYEAGIEAGLLMKPLAGGPLNAFPANHVVTMHYGGIKDETPCLVEDSAHRIEPNDPLVGKIRCYSFHGTKAITTGHGGMFVTTDKDIYQFARLANNDGIERIDNGDKTTWDYKVRMMSGGYDGADINAAIGREQLKKLPGFLKRRNAILARYNQAFETNWQGNSFYVYFVPTLEDVSRLITHLKDKGIEASYHYPGTGWKGVSLPLYPLLTDEEVEYVIESVSEYLGQPRNR